ncbi:hypothetical protein PV755_26085, partial [Streptomyces caniscabiei]|nr:hypothetical protein [Streptomyces caniscabiei]MDX3512353.1 hypothetical protein [Streptomyces caniscabiei]MDX3721604.1 hypothetical protein [Streptomyces caniscabiei]
MGIRLIVEILDHWQDAELTPGERWDLLVLAENANDGTRLTFGPVHAPHILQRANKSPKGWKNAITALLRKKVITTHVPGRIKQVAVYHLEHLCPDPPHSGHKGLCTKPVAAPDGGVADDSVTSGHSVGDSASPTKEGHPTDDPVNQEGHPTDDPMGHPADDPLGQEGHPGDAKRVIQEVTPTPPYSSFKDSPLTTSSSSVAEDSSSASVAMTDADGGGGGGESFSSEDQDQEPQRADAFVASLDYRGKLLDKKQQQQLRTLAAAALAAGWSEDGLRRYLDISDDRDVRNPAGLYAHRLDPERLPEASVGVSPQLPPACSRCLARNPAAATDPAERVAPLGGPCPRCHPATMGQSPEVPPACQLCIDENPSAEFNIRWRFRAIDGTQQACPDCHPTRIAFLATQRRDTADGGMWERAAARAAQRKATGARAAAHTA